MVAGDGRKPLKDADKSHENGDRRRNAECNGGQMFCAQLSAHDRVDRAAADNGNVGNKDRSGETKERFERNVGRKKILRHDAF